MIPDDINWLHSVGKEISENAAMINYAISDSKRLALKLPLENLSRIALLLHEDSTVPERVFSRVEIIGNGREYVSWEEHAVSIQDNGRTLKLFKKPKSSHMPLQTKELSTGNWVICSVTNCGCGCHK